MAGGEAGGPVGGRGRAWPEARGPARDRWAALLAGSAPILADGAMGTMLMEAGLPPGDPPETWNVDRPAVVGGIHRAYLDAGARIVLTNTLGGNPRRLGLHGLGGRCEELNVAGARLAREAVEAAGGRAVVAGDLGPTGAILEPLGDLTVAEAVAGFAAQAAALAAGGVDVVWIETMSALEEAAAAVEGARRGAPGRPILVTLSFDTRGRTMMGVTPEQAVAALATREVAAMGANCGLGPAEVEVAVATMRRAVPGAVLVAKANAGMPELIGDRAVYAATPEAMARHALAACAAGARIVSGCCGSTPAHARAMAAALGAAGGPGGAP